jgi:oligoribonuclease
MTEALVDKVYIDLETNGLNDLIERNGLMVSGASVHCILEIGIILTDKNERVIDVFESSIRIDPSDIYNADKWCKNQHTTTGTFDKCLSSPDYLKEVEKKVIAFLEKNNAKDRLLIAGQSVHFDKEFIKYQMPTLFKMFNHQSYDISTLLKVNKEKYPDIVNELSEIKKELYNHTALDDIAFSLISGRTYNDAACGLFKTNQSEINGSVKQVVHSNKDLILEAVSEYRTNKEDQRYDSDADLCSIEISNFNSGTKTVAVASKDPDDWSDDIDIASDLTFDVKLDQETSIRVNCVSTDFKTLMESEVSITYNENAKNDPLKSYIEGEGLESKFMSDFRRLEILKFAKHVKNRMGIRVDATIETRRLPNIFKAYFNENAFENRLKLNVEKVANKHKERILKHS